MGDQHGERTRFEGHASTLGFGGQFAPCRATPVAICGIQDRGSGPNASGERDENLLISEMEDGQDGHRPIRQCERLRRFVPGNVRLRRAETEPFAKRQ